MARSEYSGVVPLLPRPVCLAESVGCLGEQPHFKRILDWYTDYAGKGSGGMSILFPVGALRALRRLMTFSKNR